MPKAEVIDLEDIRDAREDRQSMERHARVQEFALELGTGHPLVLAAHHMADFMDMARQDRRFRRHLAEVLKDAPPLPAALEIKPS